MAIKVALQNPHTKEIRLVKLGWSWVLFFFSSFFGVPLFLRKLKSWGYLMLGLAIATPVFALLTANPLGSFLHTLTLCSSFAWSIYLGLKGNEITAKTWLARGWQFVDPNAETTKFAKMRWSMFDQPLSSASGDQVTQQTTP